MFADGSQNVWKIQGLMKAVSAGLEDAIRRFKLAEQAKVDLPLAPPRRGQGGFPVRAPAVRRIDALSPRA